MVWYQFFEICLLLVWCVYLPGFFPKCLCSCVCNYRNIEGFKFNVNEITLDMMVCKLLFFFLLCLRYNNIHNSFYYNIVLHRLELYLFSHSITEAHLSCFQIFLNTNNAAMNIFLYDASLDSHVWVYFCRLEVELLNKKLSGLNFIFHVFTFLFFLFLFWTVF